MSVGASAEKCGEAGVEAGADEKYEGFDDGIKHEGHGT